MQTELRIADWGLRIEGPGKGMVRVAALLLAVMLSACHRGPVRPAVPPPPATLASYAAAEKSFAAGDYAAAARSYEDYLATEIADNRDQAMFRAGLAYALSDDTTDNTSRSRALLQRMVSLYPGSPYTAPASLILKLQADIAGLRDNLKDQQEKVKTLTEELKRLKDIDMRRRPSRPPQ